VKSRELLLNLTLLGLGIFVSLVLVEVFFHALERYEQTYPVVFYDTDVPNLRLWCYDERFTGIPDWDLRQAHPFGKLAYLDNMDQDSALVGLDPREVPYAIEVRMNADGFRERELTELKEVPQEAVTTLVVGDSFCFGQGVRQEDRFSDILEEKLNSGNGPRHELINLCTPGADILRISFVARKSVEYFGPVRRVLYSFTLNDPIQDEATQALNRAIDDFLHFRQPFFMASFSPALSRLPGAALRWFGRRMARNEVSIRTLEWYRRMYSDQNAGWKQTQRLLSDTAAYCRTRGVELVVALFPVFYHLDDYPLRQVHAELARFCQQNGIPLVDLLDLYAGKKEQDYWVHPRDFHPNGQAHREAAKFLHAALDW
jgi:hypothetical protein